MTGHRVILANCYDSRDHTIHVSDPRPSMHQCVDGLEVRLCPGGRMGDKRVREYAGRIDELAEIVRIEQVSRELAELLGETSEPVDWRRHTTQSFSTPEDYDVEGPDPYEDHDPDGYEADRAADRYEAHLFRD